MREVWGSENLAELEPSVQLMKKAPWGGGLSVYNHQLKYCSTVITNSCAPAPH